MIIENRGGAGGALGTEQVAHSAADGYTFLFTLSSHTINPLLYKLSYDPRKDLASVSNIADVSLYLVTSTALPASRCRRP